MKSFILGLVGVVCVAMFALIWFYWPKTHLPETSISQEIIKDNQNVNPIGISASDLQGNVTHELGNRLILAQLREMYPAEYGNYIIGDPFVPYRFYIAMNSDPAAIFAYDASLDLSWKKDYKVDVNAEDIVFSYIDTHDTVQKGMLLVPLIVKDGKLVFGEIAKDWSPLCESTALAFRDHLYVIDTTMRGKENPGKYSLDAKDIAAENEKKQACKEALLLDN